MCYLMKTFDLYALDCCDCSLPKFLQDVNPVFWRGHHELSVLSYLWYGELFVNQITTAMNIDLLVLMRSCGGRLESWLPWRSRCSRMQALSTVWGRLIRRLLEAFSSWSWGIEKILCVCVCVCVWEREREREHVYMHVWEMHNRFWVICMNSCSCKMSHPAGSSVSLLSLAFNLSKLESSVRAWYLSRAS